VEGVASELLTRGGKGKEGRCFSQGKGGRKRSLIRPGPREGKEETGERISTFPQRPKENKSAYAHSFLPHKKKRKKKDQENEWHSSMPQAGERNRRLSSVTEKGKGKCPSFYLRKKSRESTPSLGVVRRKGKKTKGFLFLMARKKQ